MTLPAMETSFERLLGSYETGRPGKTVVITAGIHGNEPAGAIAAQRVFAALAADRLPLRGRLLGFCGNLSALATNQRFIEHDLNRGWTNERARLLLGSASSDPFQHEDREQWELLNLFAGLFASAREPIVFLDLHSTSAGGSPFCAIADTLRNRTIAFALPAPVILGLEETIHGTMLSYLDGLGHISAVFEGGQHADPSTADNHESAIWIALVAAGSLRAEEIPGYAAMVNRLRAATRGQPAVVELRLRHAITQVDHFTMRPGYVNFQPVAAGEVLADSIHGDVHAPFAGRILMPLYQKQGEDGFFMVRDVHRFWLRLSSIIRRARLDVVLPLFPGVCVHPTEPDTLLADPRVARYFVVEVFHLFGFRRAGEEGGRLRFRRRRPDFRKLATFPQPAPSADAPPGS